MGASKWELIPTKSINQLFEEYIYNKEGDLYLLLSLYNNIMIFIHIITPQNKANVKELPLGKHLIGSSIVADFVIIDKNIPKEFAYIDIGKELVTLQEINQGFQINNDLGKLKTPRKIKNGEAIDFNDTKIIFYGDVLENQFTLSEYISDLLNMLVKKFTSKLPKPLETRLSKLFTKINSNINKYKKLSLITLSLGFFGFFWSLLFNVSIEARELEYNSVDNLFDSNNSIQEIKESTESLPSKKEAPIITRSILENMNYNASHVQLENRKLIITGPISSKESFEKIARVLKSDIPFVDNVLFKIDTYTETQKIKDEIIGVWMGDNPYLLMTENVKVYPGGSILLHFTLISIKKNIIIVSNGTEEWSVPL